MGVFLVLPIYCSLSSDVFLVNFVDLGDVVFLFFDLGVVCLLLLSHLSHMIRPFLGCIVMRCLILKCRVLLGDYRVFITLVIPIFPLLIISRIVLVRRDSEI